MTKTCSRCGQPKGKGKHYVTAKVSGGTIRFELRTCDECGSELSTRISNTVTRWLRNRKDKEVVIILDANGAMNTDLAHWIMSAIEMWNKRMKTSPIKITHFETDGMKQPVMDSVDMDEFFREWKNKLDYDWGNEK